MSAIIQAFKDVDLRRKILISIADYQCTDAAGQPTVNGTVNVAAGQTVPVPGYGHCPSTCGWTAWRMTH